MIKKRDFTKFSLLMLLATASVVQLHAMHGMVEGPVKTSGSSYSYKNDFSSRTNNSFGSKNLLNDQPNLALTQSSKLTQATARKISEQASQGMDVNNANNQSLTLYNPEFAKQQISSMPTMSQRAYNALPDVSGRLGRVRTNIRTVADNANEQTESLIRDKNNNLLEQPIAVYGNKSYSNLLIRALNRTLNAIENLPNTLTGRSTGSKTAAVEAMKSANIKPEDLTSEDTATVNNVVKDEVAKGNDTKTTGQNVFIRLYNSLSSKKSSNETATAVETGSPVENPLQAQAKTINARFKSGNANIARQANLQQSVQSNNNSIIIV